MKQPNPIGLYRHFKGAYYFMQRVCKNSDDSLVCEYFNVLHPEYGFFTRSYEDWCADVSGRPDNITGQVHRFERVTELDSPSLKDYDTESLVREVCGRSDSPFSYTSVEQYFSCDYCVGEVHEGNDFFPAGVSTIVAFDEPKDAFEYLRKHYNSRTKVFKRAFIEQKQVF